jgi:AraC-like DNA-binding protein
MDFGLSPGEAGAAQLLRLKKCQDLLKRRLSGPMKNLFVELTGLRLHAVWHQPLNFHKPGDELRLCPTARGKCDPNGKLPATCQACLKRFWTVAMQPAFEVPRFVGQCGLTNVCACVHADGAACPLLTLVLQALIKEESSAPPAGVSASAFDHAVALLRLIHRKLAAVLQAWAAHSELGSSQRRLRISEVENARLRKQVHRHDPELSEASSCQSPGSHAEDLVQEMIAYVHRHYHRLMNLGDVAAALKMNSSYLSTLFSHAVGMTFHHYLEEVRMAKAKELLLDPHRRVCEVACAVGYASADQFRHAFKAHAGVPPSTWR